MATREEEKDYDHRESRKDYSDSPSPLPHDRLEYDHHSERALVRKVDWRLLPILGALYSIALIDRVNISAARVAGMGEDLGLEIGQRYTIALVVFFPPYFLLELPSNLLLRKVGSANWLAGIAFSWGELYEALSSSYCCPHILTMLNRHCDAGSRFREVVRGSCRMSSNSWDVWSGILSRMRVSDNLLVYSIWDAEEVSRAPWRSESTC